LQFQNNTATKILVVDDEMDIQTLFVQGFRKEIRARELSFAFALSGEEALRILKENESQYMLILLRNYRKTSEGFLKKTKPSLLATTY
jgi:CheY-like chemotaxis protein